ncbi:hypothetical protein ACJMK2_015178 [Sinanodonta woodiana]|uniref:DZIP3-like HEPN domain-containing protein n=1 Tax=Sinanodonta woodiana TaxID=1069815 RepID=A0ABD3V2U6_SINWO
MNHARLCIALATVCGKALRKMLLDNVPIPYRDIYKAILGNQAKLIGARGRPLLSQDQINLVFSDPLGQQTGTLETFDVSLLYTLIRNVSTVQAPITGWGIIPQPSDKSPGASVERIRSYRNRISGHSPDAKINSQHFEDYWQNLKDELHDIEVVFNSQVYSTELEKQKRQVISIFNAC